MPTEKGVARMLRQHQEEGRTFLTLETVLDYLSPSKAGSGQTAQLSENPGLIAALEDTEIILYNLGCRPTEGGYILPPRKTSH